MRERRDRRRLRRDRGATVVEYALGITFVVIGSLSGIQFLEDESGDEFDDRANRSGAPDLSEAASDGGTGGSGTSSGSTGGSTTVTEVFFAGFSNVEAKKITGAWTAKLRVNVEDSGGRGVGGVRVEGTWNYTHGSTPVSVAATCNQTTGAGGCQFQLTDIPNGVGEVTFTMTAITGGEPPAAYNGGPQSQVVLKATNQ